MYRRNNDSLIHVGMEGIGGKEYACKNKLMNQEEKKNLSCNFYVCENDTFCFESENVTAGNFELNVNGTACVDINECERGSAKCDQNANCTNTVGSFLCECKRNYEGDGAFCSEIIPSLPKVDWCSLRVYCGDKANCENIQTKAICKCNKGYHGDPYKGCNFGDPTKYLIFNTTVRVSFNFLEGLKYKHSDLYYNFTKDLGIALDFLMNNMPEYVKGSMIVENPRYEKFQFFVSKQNHVNISFPLFFVNL